MSVHLISLHVKLRLINHSLYRPTLNLLIDFLMQLLVRRICVLYSNNARADIVLITLTLLSEHSGTSEEEKDTNIRVEVRCLEFVDVNSVGVIIHIVDVAILDTRPAANTDENYAKTRQCYSGGDLVSAEMCDTLYGVNLGFILSNT